VNYGRKIDGKIDRKAPWEIGKRPCGGEFKSIIISFNK